MERYEDYLLQNEENLRRVKSVDPDENTFCLWYEYDCSLAFCYNEFGEWFWSNSLDEIKEAFINISLNLFLCCKFDYYMEEAEENEVIRYKTIDRIDYIRRNCLDEDVNVEALNKLENLILNSKQAPTSSLTLS